ncbi:MAG: glycine--tRNA ligase subunit beta [Methylobacillus sp.]|jgi:glycyl-tRNA synthetase beta chain|nr:glycine--tRNA ligase subunit beta [Methylobacillus sp.]
MNMSNLLVELLVEELPPKALKKLGAAFAVGLFESLKEQGLTAQDTRVTPYATPRRLAAHITDVSAQAGDKPVSQKLMPVAVGLDADGQATPALLKKLAALGADAAVVPQLKRENDGKAEVLFLDTVMPGAKLADGLQKALDETLAKLPIPKVMTYQLHSGCAMPGWDSVQFVRPAHGLVALRGADVIPVSALGLTAGRTTRGHRFEAQHDPITLADADSYTQTLREQGAVIAGFEERRAEIARQLAEAAQKENLAPVEDDALLDEVTALVERPNVLLGRFEDAFLEVPQECLILTMKANQKYFPLLDANGKLTHKFLIVSNIRPADASAVIGGNERVVRPRLADAKFFYDQDRKKSLESRVPGLDKVVYHNKLGTQGARMERVREIARAIARQLATDLAAADRAAQLAKTDLLTDMVGEFPELQGIMGGYYARHDGLGDEIADAIEDHYKPRFAGDDLPRNATGVAVALADKLETLVGLFGIGEKPTGDKDPFALRRHALGVIRILIEKGLPIGLTPLIETGWPENGRIDAYGLRPSQPPQNVGLVGSGSALVTLSAETPSQVREFICERLFSYLRELGYSTQEIDAVMALNPDRLDQIKPRLDAVRNFSKMPEAASLAAANKRVGNILKKAETAVTAGKTDPALLKEPAEATLNFALASVKPQADAAFERGDYTTALQTLALLKAPVDDFFDHVMVNAEDPALRANRLTLLATLHDAMNRVADLSRLAG